MNKQPKPYHDLKNDVNRVAVFQGGTRSGKTYSILQVLMELAYTNPNTGMVISIVRKTLPSLKQTAYRDFLEILHENNWYRTREHNKSENTYNLFGNTFEFFAVDQAQKVRGSKRHILFCNEANELLWDEFFQLNIRTKYKAILDFNPTMEEAHWIWKNVLVRKDCGYYISTYKDNPFLSKTEINEIESLQETDLYYWNIFGLGMRTKNPAVIFTTETVDSVPETARFVGYGMDFGYSNHPSTLVAVYQDKKNLYFDEVFYQEGMTNDDIDYFMYTNKIARTSLIVADSAEPKSIDDLRRRGWRIIKAKKGHDSVNHGIDLLKRYKLYITAKSSNIKKEFGLYKWKQNSDGTLLNMPIDKYNHTVDAIRYICQKSLSGMGTYRIS